MHDKTQSGQTDFEVILTSFLSKHFWQIDTLFYFGLLWLFSFVVVSVLVRIC